MIKQDFYDHKVFFGTFFGNFWNQQWISERHFSVLGEPGYSNRLMK
jgi:hypothetical protein